jgi:hypothetical protein
VRRSERFDDIREELLSLGFVSVSVLSANGERTFVTVMAIEEAHPKSW